MAPLQAVLSLYGLDRQKALNQAAERLLPNIRHFFERVNQVESSLSGQVAAANEEMRRLVHIGSRWALGAGTAGVAVGFFFAIWLFRNMSRSLHELQKGTAALSAGNLDYHIPLTRHDELGELAQRFNAMADSMKQLEAQTVHMHRMSAVGQLAGGVAHEINNPLTGVLGQSQLLLDKLPPGDALRVHVEKIERAAVRCRRIVRSLLDFSRQKESEFSEFDVNETTNSAVDLCELDIQRHRITVLKNLSGSLPFIKGNSAQVQQVFLNIITNAIQAMPEGGMLTLSSRKATLPVSGGGAPLEAVEVGFLDTGHGINTEHSAHIFEPFFTTKEIGKGTGLGLSVSLGIVRHHGGNITVESGGAGKGASFRVTLPVDPAKMPDRPADDAVASPAKKDSYAGTTARY
jgi:two-component system, NtrC family, sensor kinase